MTIHHTHIKRAEKMGVVLTEEGRDQVSFFIPQYAISGRASSSKLALQIADEKLKARRQKEYEDDNDNDSEPVGSNLGGDGAGDPDNAAARPVVARINGVAIDGGIAYREGTLSADCPYSSEASGEGELDGSGGEGEYEKFIRWNEEWDAAADEAAEEEGTGGSVVSEKFRAKYAEMGHPTHCGDWLAEVLNNIVLNKAGTNIELFEEICNLNGVSLAKYKHEGKGWEGRLRMTGRNLMAKKVWQAQGVLKLPQTINGGEMKAPAEWMSAQRFKGAAK